MAEIKLVKVLRNNLNCKKYYFFLRIFKVKMRFKKVDH